MPRMSLTEIKRLHTPDWLRSDPETFRVGDILARKLALASPALIDSIREHGQTAPIELRTDPYTCELEWLEARLIAFASPEVVTAMQKSSTAHRDAMAFAADQAALRAQEASGEPISDDQVSQLLQWTMSTGARKEADKADDAVIDVIRTDLHGHGQPLTD